MKLRLNDKEIEGVLEKDFTLANALQAIQEEYVGANEVIAGAWVDGEPLTAERLSKWKDRSIEDFDEAHIATEVRNVFASNGLRIIAEKLSESEGEREQIAEHICQGRGQEAITILQSYLQLWNTAQQTLGSVCRLMEIELESLEVFDQENNGGPKAVPVIERVGQLTEQLEQIRGALEAGDLVLLGDILDYEFGDLTRQWEDMLKQLAAQFSPVE